ncbi:hypothetical protein QCA50_008731 [Cerrena zonata]|uniref:Zinc-finger domain-containing protein n=1 Tax=Cerrena zonata TaxID=2478898 RepID=A0AAW0GEE5_9APHY
MFSRLAQDSSRSPSVTNHFHDTIIEISSELSPEIPVYSLPPSSDPFDSDIQILNSPPRLSKRTVRPQRRPYVLVPSLPTGLAKEEYIANTSALSGGAKNARLLSSNTLSPGTRRIALGLRPNRKRKGPEDAITPSPRKRARRQPQEEHKASRTVIGFSTEPVEGFVGEDELDTLLGVHPIEIGEEIPYEDAGKWAVQALWISLKHATGRTDSRYETSRQAWPVKSPPAISKSGYPSIQPGSQSDSRPTRNSNTHNPHSPSPKKKPQPKPHRPRQRTQTSIPPSQPSSSSLPQPTGFVISNEYIAAVQHYSSSLPRSPTPPNLGPTSFGSDYHESSTSISPDQHSGIFDVLNVSNSTDERSARNDNARNSPLVDKVHPSPMLDANQSELGSVFQENGYNTHSFQSIFNIVPWSASLRTVEGQQFEQPVAGPSSGPSTIYKNHAEIPNMGGFGNGTIDPSVLGGAPMLISGHTPSLSPSPPPGDQSLNSLPTRHASTSTHISTDLDRTTVSRSSALSSNRPLAKSKGKNKAKPSEELLATVSSMKRRSVDRNSTGGEKRDRKPSTRIREALQQVDYELTDEDADADGETDDEDFEPLASLPSTRRETPPTQGQPKPSRKSISTLKGSKASRKSVEEYCHQCRNKPKMLKVRCSGTRPDGVPCGLYFCERCITRRYPEIEFNAFDEDFICPKCDDFCNCTACCRRRGEEYISSRGVGPSPFLQNSQNASASTQPRNSSSLSKPYPMTDRNPPVTPALAVPPGMFWGTVYDIDGKRIGAGVVSEDRQVIVTNDPLPPRKIIYVGKPPPRKGGPPSSTTGAAEEPAHNVGLQNRAYIGSKPPMLNHSLYKSLEEHFALLTRERSSSPLTPVHSSDPVQPTTVDGFLLAQAIQEMAKKTE